MYIPCNSATIKVVLGIFNLYINSGTAEYAMQPTTLQNKKIVLIGGAGFIGHHLALYLSKLGAEVSIVDSLQVNNLVSLIGTPVQHEFGGMYESMTHQRISLIRKANIPLYVVDAREYHALSHILGEIRPQIIVHLAAIAHAGLSNKNPFSTFDHSLRTLENALDYARDGDVEQFVYFSSSMVYGNFNGQNVTEETLCEPMGIYGALKYAGEKIVIAYNQVFNLPYTIVRPSALYGERCISRRVGQILIESAMQGKEIVINGNGSERLDFTYIQDLVHGISQVVQNKNSLGQIFNLTFGSARSVADMLELLRMEFPNIKVRSEAKDKLMPERGTLCVDKAREMINYNPQFPLERGYPQYIKWYQESFGHIRNSSNAMHAPVL